MCTSRASLCKRSMGVKDSGDLRQQLQAKVSDRLASRGVSTADRWKAKPKAALTAEEMKRLERQRANKRRWARKERAKSRQELESLKQANGTLEYRNQTLKKTLNKLAEEELRLKSALLDHHCSARIRAKPLLQIVYVSSLHSLDNGKKKLVKLGHDEGSILSSGPLGFSHLNNHGSGSKFGARKGWTHLTGQRLSIHNGKVRPVLHVLKPDVPVSKSSSSLGRQSSASLGRQSSGEAVRAGELLKKEITIAEIMKACAVSGGVWDGCQGDSPQLSGELDQAQLPSSSTSFMQLLQDDDVSGRLAMAALVPESAAPETSSEGASDQGTLNASILKTVLNEVTQTNCSATGSLVLESMNLEGWPVTMAVQPSIAGLGVLTGHSSERCQRSEFQSECDSSDTIYCGKEDEVPTKAKGCLNSQCKSARHPSTSNVNPWAVTPFSSSDDISPLGRTLDVDNANTINMFPASHLSYPNVFTTKAPCATYVPPNLDLSFSRSSSTSTASESTTQIAETSRSTALLPEYSLTPERAPNGKHKAMRTISWDGELDSAFKKPVNRRVRYLSLQDSRSDEIDDKGEETEQMEEVEINDGVLAEISCGTCYLIIDDSAGCEINSMQVSKTHEGLHLPLQTEYLIQSNPQYSKQCDLQYPVQSDSQYTIQSDSQYTIQSDSQYTVQSDSQYQVQSDSQYQVQSDFNTKPKVTQHQAQNDSQYQAQSDSQYQTQSDSQYPSQIDSEYNAQSEYSSECAVVRSEEIPHTPSTPSSPEASCPFRVQEKRVGDLMVTSW